MHAQAFEKLLTDMSGVSKTWAHVTHEAWKAAMDMDEKVDVRASAHTEVVQPYTCW